MKADTFRPTRKTVTIIQGSSRTQAPWWRKLGSKGAYASPQASGTSTPTTKQASGDVSECEYMKEVVMEESQAINLPHVAFGEASEVPMNHGFVEIGGMDSLTNSINGLRMDKCMGNGSILNYNIGSQAKEVVDLIKKSCTTCAHTFSSKRGRPFRFEAIWVKDDSCEKVIKDSWDSASLAASVWGFSKKLSLVQDNLKAWNRQSFGHVRNSLAKKLKELKVHHRLRIKGCYGEVCGSLEFLPTMTNLVQRHIATIEVCSACQTQPEDTLHALWSCTKLELAWSSLSWSLPFANAHALSFQELLHRFMQIKENYRAEIFVTIAWMLWNRRNAL
nr:hypothetical protein CFP56_37676 [Quercus suber]